MNGRFEKGQSGNPAGRPVGRPDKRVTARETLMHDLFTDAIRGLELAVKEDEPWAIKEVLAYALAKPRASNPDEITELLDRLSVLEAALRGRAA